MEKTYFQMNCVVRNQFVQQTSKKIILLLERINFINGQTAKTLYNTYDRNRITWRSTKPFEVHKKRAEGLKGLNGRLHLTDTC